MFPANLSSCFPCLFAGFLIPLFLQAWWIWPWSCCKFWCQCGKSSLAKHGSNTIEIVAKRLAQIDQNNNYSHWTKHWDNAATALTSSFEVVFFIRIIGNTVSHTTEPLPLCSTKVPTINSPPWHFVWDWHLFNGAMAEMYWWTVKRNLQTKPCNCNIVIGNHHAVILKTSWPNRVQFFMFNHCCFVENNHLQLISNVFFLG